MQAPDGLAPKLKHVPVAHKGIWPREGFLRTLNPKVRTLVSHLQTIENVQKGRLSCILTTFILALQHHFCHVLGLQKQPFHTFSYRAKSSACIMISAPVLSFSSRPPNM